MAVLHQLMQPDERAWRECLAFLLEGDAVVLVDEGVGLLTEPEALNGLQAKAGPDKLVALRADVLARGLAQVCETHAVAMLGDDGWVEWVFAHERSLSWK